MSVLAIAFGAIFVSNVVLNQFYGLCPFLGVSTKKSSALSMGMAVTFVITLSTMIAYVIYHKVLVPNGIEYLSTIVFILVIASFVQLVEMVIKRFSATVYSALGVYLPLITTNCAVLGVAIDVTVNGTGSSKILMAAGQVPTFFEATVYALGISIGYALVIFLFSAIREEMAAYPIKRNWQGIPIALITAFIMAMIFVGFGGIV
ncbi:Electron transport complex protein RnfA [Candidatus Izimaplasma bacterium HR1]|jgi:electron transport complex protein RnfA|uniref:electron transport complex protein RnfA n=1 Tax=Candidatus Izimoplasma sp. HR1 TaxID=1541959 RepID=UPI0004F7779D|nr:Electron transport complex protein RnfA [Candidatus Izimaplasma bacterium HR1]